MNNIRIGLVLLSINLACTTSALAKKACESVKWTTDENIFEVCYNVSLKAYLTADCEEKKCGAAELVRLAKNYQPASKTRNGRLLNPGSPVCNDLGGKVVIAKNERESQTAFCMAADKSVVALVSLAHGP